MAQEKDIFQSLRYNTISCLISITDLKKEISNLQVEIERKDNELISIKRKNQKLEEQIQMIKDKK